MRLNPDAQRLLGQARIGMLAIHGRELPLVNPAAFHLAWDSIWITTSRHAVKLALARRDPRAAFMVDAGGWGVLMQGLLETYDLRSISGQVRATLDAPRFLTSLAGYGLKNANFVGGYLLDLAGIPRDWWPHNRVVLRLRPRQGRALSSLAAPPAVWVEMPGLPPGLRRRLAQVGTAYVCWYQSGWPALAPGLWTSREGQVLAWLPPGSLAPPAAGSPAAVVVEYHHRYRATRMLGACIRGRLRPSPDAAVEIGSRYHLELEDGGRGLHLEASKVTWWNGFEVRTVPLAAVAGQAAQAAAGA